MFAYLVLLFTIVPAVELMLLIKVGQHIGAFNTVMIIIMTGLWGAYLARLQGFLVLQKIQHNLDRGVMPTDEMFDGVMILIGGVLLLTPGFVTDIIGFLLLIPLTRAFLRLLIKRNIEQAMASGRVVRVDMRPGRGPDEPDDVEDAQFYE